MMDAIDVPCDLADMAFIDQLRVFRPGPPSCWGLRGDRSRCRSMSVDDTIRWLTIVEKQLAAIPGHVAACQLENVRIIIADWRTHPFSLSESSYIEYAFKLMRSLVEYRNRNQGQNIECSADKEVTVVSSVR